MSAPGRRYIRSAVVGLVVTAAFVRYQLLTDPQSPITRNPVLMVMFVVLCPPSLLSLAFDPEVGTGNYYFLWTLIALMNAAMYATVRVLRSRRLRGPG